MSSLFGTTRAIPPCCSKLQMSHGRPITATRAQVFMARAMSLISPSVVIRLVTIGHFTTRGFQEESATWVFGAEYPMVRWLEANGYDVAYFTGVDAARSGNLIENHKLYLSVGHDEYWSGPRRAQCRSRPRCWCESGILQRQRSLLENSLGKQCRWNQYSVPHTGLLQRDAGTEFKPVSCGSNRST